VLGSGTRRIRSYAAGVAVTDCPINLPTKTPSAVRYSRSLRSCASLEGRLPGEYNEWILRDFEVMSVLAVPPFEVSQLRTPKYPDDIPSHIWLDQTPTDDGH
jgi:hypothetical protein